MQTCLWVWVVVELEHSQISLLSHHRSHQTYQIPKPTHQSAYNSQSSFQAEVPDKITNSTLHATYHSHLASNQHILEDPNSLQHVIHMWNKK
jgi:hypothetical protein